MVIFREVASHQRGRSQPEIRFKDGQDLQISKEFQVKDV